MTMDQERYHLVKKLYEKQNYQSKYENMAFNFISLSFHHYGCKICYIIVKFVWEKIIKLTVNKHLKIYR